MDKYCVPPVYVLSDMLPNDVGTTHIVGNTNSSDNKDNDDIDINISYRPMERNMENIDMNQANKDIDIVDTDMSPDNIDMYKKIENICYSNSTNYNKMNFDSDFFHFLYAPSLAGKVERLGKNGEIRRPISVDEHRRILELQFSKLVADFNIARGHYKAWCVLDRGELFETIRAIQKFVRQETQFGRRHIIVIMGHATNHREKAILTLANKPSVHLDDILCDLDFIAENVRPTLRVILASCYSHLIDKKYNEQCKLEVIVLTDSNKQNLLTNSEFRSEVIGGQLEILYAKHEELHSHFENNLDCKISEQKDTPGLLKLFKQTWRRWFRRPNYK